MALMTGRQLLEALEREFERLKMDEELEVTLEEDDAVMVAVQSGDLVDRFEATPLTLEGLEQLEPEAAGMDDVCTVLRKHDPGALEEEE